MPIYPGVSDSQKKVPPLPPSVASRSDSGSGRAFDNGATFLTFNPTIFDGKLPIIDYLITATAEDNVAVTQTVTDLNSFVFTGLRSGVRYRYKIRARNSVSDSADSSEVGPDTATTVPGRPTSLTAINLSNGGGITLNWVAPSNAGKAITSYTITPSVGAPIVTNSTSTTYAFSGVVGTVYNFTVAATNENGTGLDSTASGTVTPTAPVVVTTQAPGGGGGGGGGGATIGITSFTASAGAVDGAPPIVPNLNWSAFGYASWSASGLGCSSGIVNGTTTGVSGLSWGCANPSTFCGQTATATLTVYSGLNGTGVSATSTATMAVQSSGTGCPSSGGGGGGVANAWRWTTCCNTNGTYALKYGTSFDSQASAQGFANQACTGGGGTVQGGTGSFGSTFPSLECSAPVALPCSGGNGNCATPACAACDPVLSGIRIDSSCPSGFRDVCWTGGSCPNTGSCTPLSGTGGGGGVTPTTTAAPIFVTTTAGVQPCAGPCNGTWVRVNGVCQCRANTTAAPTTAAPTTSISCLCRDARGRCLTARQCGLF